jgi:CheY-like chemotaxis protein
MEREIKILLVEDDEADAAVTIRLLNHNRLNKDLFWANNGQDAIEALERKNREGNSPNLILLDINLPDISGIDLLIRIKENQLFREIPVVILTGSNEDQDIQKSYDLGASSYLVKPICNDAMKQVIKKLFSF